MPWDMNGSVSFADLSDGEKLDKVIAALRQRGTQTASGFEKIEHQHPQAVLTASVEDTVFAWVADALRIEGVQGDLNTVGDVMVAMGANSNMYGPTRFKTDEAAQHYLAHIVGCHCHGSSSEVSAVEVADRLQQHRNTVSS